MCPFLLPYDIAIVGFKESALLMCRCFCVEAIVLCALYLVPNLIVTVPVKIFKAGGGLHTSGKLYFFPVMVVPPDIAPGKFIPLLA